MPGEPATTHTAACHLWVSAGRAGHQSATSWSSTRWARVALTSRPMSATSRSPVRVAPDPNRRPGLRAAKVTVRSAEPTPGPAWPVRPSTPLGMSTASTGVPGGPAGQA